VKTDYPYIRVWGQYMGSGQYYIDGQVERARETNAPPTAIYERYEPGGIKTGTWSTADQIENTSTRYAFGQMCERANIPVPEWKEVVRDGKEAS